VQELRAGQVQLPRRGCLGRCVHQDQPTAHEQPPAGCLRVRAAARYVWMGGIRSASGVHAAGLQGAQEWRSIWGISDHSRQQQLQDVANLPQRFRGASVRFGWRTEEDQLFPCSWTRTCRHVSAQEWRGGGKMRTASCRTAEEKMYVGRSVHDRTPTRVQGKVAVHRLPKSNQCVWQYCAGRRIRSVRVVQPMQYVSSIACH
jgi:hypothetical protein